MILEYSCRGIPNGPPFDEAVLSVDSSGQLRCLAHRLRRHAEMARSIPVPDQSRVAALSVIRGSREENWGLAQISPISVFDTPPLNKYALVT
jgi:hypothetical protein